MCCTISSIATQLSSGNEVSTDTGGDLLHHVKTVGRVNRRIRDASIRLVFLK